MNFTIFISLMLYFTYFSTSCAIFDKLESINIIKDSDSLNKTNSSINKKLFFSNEKESMTCEPGLYQINNSPFAIYVFCESFLKIYIAIVYSSPIGAPVEKAWTLNNRYWSGEWSKDVGKIKFNPKNDNLFVQTSNINGVSNHYILDLYNKKVLIKESIEKLPEINLIKNKINFTNSKFFDTSKICQSQARQDYTTLKSILYKIDTTPFVIHVFCEDALGHYITIIYDGQLDQITKGAWILNDRHWSGEWSKDVNSFEFNTDMNTLFVKTQNIYGTGKSYLLNLYDKEIIMTECPQKTVCFEQ